MNLLMLFNPLHAVKTILKNKDLLTQLARQNILVRYKGSGFGRIWSFITPLFMLTIYTFVFGFVFKSRWDIDGNESQMAFVLTMFCGLAVFNIFSESVSASTTIVSRNVNYVKKVVFPLEILPVNMLMTSLFFSGVWFIILFAGIVIFLNKICVTAICLPLVICPLIILSQGICWFLASLGVYIRDMEHMVNLLLRALLFMTPIFYPVTRIPEKFRFLFLFNPLAVIVQEMRNVLLFNKWPNWWLLGIVTVFSLIVFQFGYIWFMKTKRGFADVL
jgi:lipopolysaccharide transport system permease protein